MTNFNKILEGLSEKDRKVLEDGNFHDVRVLEGRGLSFSFTEVGFIPKEFLSQFDGLMSLIHKDDIRCEIIFKCELYLLTGNVNIDRECSFKIQGQEINLSELMNDVSTGNVRENILNYYDEKYENIFEDIFEIYEEGV